MRGYAVGIYTRDQLRAMTANQVNAIIIRDLYEDAYSRQRETPVAYTGKNLAEGIETMLCVCPACGRLGTISSRGDCFGCTCGLSARYTEYGFLEGEGLPFDNIGDWDVWQTEALRALADSAGDDAIISDTGISMGRHHGHHGLTPLGTGRLTLFRDRLVFESLSIPLTAITGMDMHGPMGLSFSTGAEHYELSAAERRCIRKYMTLCDYLRTAPAAGKQMAAEENAAPAKAAASQ